MTKAWIVGFLRVSNDMFIYAIVYRRQSGDIPQLNYHLAFRLMKLTRVLFTNLVGLYAEEFDTLNEIAHLPSAFWSFSMPDKEARNHSVPYRVLPDKLHRSHLLLPTINKRAKLPADHI